MNVVYVRSAKVGEKCRVESEIVGEVGRGFGMYLFLSPMLFHST